MNESLSLLNGNLRDCMYKEFFVAQNARLTLTKVEGSRVLKYLDITAPHQGD